MTIAKIKNSDGGNANVSTPNAKGRNKEWMANHQLGCFRRQLQMAAATPCIETKTHKVRQSAGKNRAKPIANTTPHNCETIAFTKLFTY